MLVIYQAFRCVVGQVVLLWYEALAACSIANKPAVYIM